MNFKVHFLLSLFILFFYIADAFNITKILSQYSDYSTFNNYLTQTQLASQINSRQTITVLAVSNGNISPLSGKSADMLQAIMSVHVILDYYDTKKLQNLPNKTAILTTLFQSTGRAIAEQGFINATDTSSGVAFGSAVKGASLNANLVGSVVSQPYNISVLQISTVIIPEGIDNATKSSPPSPSPPSPSPRSSARPAKSPTSAPRSSARPAKSPTSAKSPVPAKARPPSRSRSPPSPPPASSPSDADTPASAPDSPKSSAPTEDSPADSSPSLGSIIHFSLGSIAVIVLSTMLLV